MEGKKRRMRTNRSFPDIKIGCVPLVIRATAVIALNDLLLALAADATATAEAVTIAKTS